MSDVLSPPPHPLLYDLLRRWQRGWVLARDLGVPEEVGGALRVPVHGHGRRWEFLVADPDGTSAAVRRLAGEVSAAPRRDWLTVVTGAPDTVALTMHRAGLRLSDGEEFLMACRLDGQPVVPAAAPYRVRTRVEGAVVRVRVLAPDGGEAASGAMAVAGADAVADRITTAPAHRRRGLGRTVMGALAERARDLGAREGLLVASEQGRHLYGSLGWREHAHVVIGATPHGMAAGEADGSPAA
ncbi:GNAT family N-acetyltransferase [Nocardiopsis sp. CT-R113]|uniref:GNAT family N-acetyltransferase n=1 Tax=Nocardiopsis codii TaxID=3065942 RepID=A0ABU7KCV0_9ACTN|nr:GNAT family N-acetyltransferase [Nocardiopsis sp. CT-R113]MEE2040063.1 GNAT family N-acetyltransferase [Nocardiopsis sp. CT-R113]